MKTLSRLGIMAVVMASMGIATAGAALADPDDHGQWQRGDQARRVEQARRAEQERRERMAREAHERWERARWAREHGYYPVSAQPTIVLPQLQPAVVVPPAAAIVVPDARPSIRVRLSF